MSDTQREQAQADLELARRISGVGEHWCGNPEAVTLANALIASEAEKAELRKALERYSNPWAIEIWNHRTESWNTFCHDEPLTLQDAEARVEGYAQSEEMKTGRFQVVPYLNASQRQHLPPPQPCTACQSKDAAARRYVEYLGVPLTNPSGEPFDERGSPAETPKPTLPDWLIGSAEALLKLDTDEALVPHGIGGHARNIIEQLLKFHTPAPAVPAQAEPKCRMCDGFGRIEIYGCPAGGMNRKFVDCPDCAAPGTAEEEK